MQAHLHSNIVLISLINILFTEKHSFLGRITDIIVLVLDDRFWKQTPICIKHCRMSHGELVKILLVPHKIITFFKQDICGKWIALQRTFSAWSPLMSKLKLLGKYFYQVPLYLFRPFTIESPKRSVSVGEFLAVKH